jgi:glycine/D-amino acid oxidase-like deaminating enzyme
LSDRYPHDTDGFVIANSVEVPDALRPRFEQCPVTDAGNGRPVILILGAGYTGLSAALKLAELQQASRNPARIVLLDACRVGDGPSGKSAGHICGLQAQPEDIYRHCGSLLAERLIAAADRAPGLVKSRIARHNIPCDLRDGYLSIRGNGVQTLDIGGSQFGIDPYPYLLGLAFACCDAGVEIHERTFVAAVEDNADGCEVTIAGGTVIRAGAVIAAGGHRMAERIAMLRSLRSRTTELKVSTLITDPIPDSVLRTIMPLAEGRRYPFANDAANVAYGSIDQRRRIIFGSNATASRDPNFRAIAQTLHSTFPSLADAYQSKVGCQFSWRPLVAAESLGFTRDELPHVGILGHSRRVFYVHALGGHGLAIGTLLGEAAATKAWGTVSGESVDDRVFEDFASVRHGWLPPWEPIRHLTASIGLSLGAL